MTEGWSDKEKLLNDDDFFQVLNYSNLKMSDEQRTVWLGIDFDKGTGGW